MCKICGKEFETGEVVLPLYVWGINFVAASVRGYIHGYHAHPVLGNDDVI